MPQSVPQTVHTNSGSLAGGFVVKGAWLHKGVPAGAGCSGQAGRGFPHQYLAQGARRGGQDNGMSIDLPPIPDVAAIIAPQQIERKKRGRGRAAAIAIGTVLILSDGSECVVVAFDAAGNPLCQPVQD